MTETATIASPDWTTVDRDVVCPLCEYNLRGLNEPRCPECGYAFEWNDLLDPQRQPHPYLFELNPRRNVRAFVRTYLAALMPRRFWRRLQPHHALRPGRLVLYWVIAASLFGMTPAFVVGREYARTIVQTRDARANMRLYLARNPNGGWYAPELRRHGSTEALLDAYYPWFSRDKLRWAYYAAYLSLGATNILIATLAWPWLTLATLMVFRASMRRAMVKRGHVLRCTVYSCDWAPWLSSLALIYLKPWYVEEHFPYFYPPASMPMLAAAGFAVYTTYRLGFAYSRYLKFDRPFATVAASQAIVFLFVTAVFVLLWGT